MGPMLRWFVFTIMFGLLPFSVSMLLLGLRGARTITAVASPALLFFSVMICASQLNGILATFSDDDALAPKKRDVLNVFFATFLVGAVLSAILYGTFVIHDINDPGLRWNTSCSRAGVKLDGCSEWLAFRVNLFSLSTWVAAFFATIGTIAEWKRSTP